MEERRREWGVGFEMPGLEGILDKDMTRVVLGKGLAMGLIMLV